MRASERGYTLIEILIVVGMIALLALGGLGFALSMKPQELSAATMQFDSIVSSARSVATAFDGATIFVTTTSDGTQNFHAQVYGHRPGSLLPIVTSPVPPIVAKTAISETNELHDPSFAIIIHSSGAIGARANFAPGDAVQGPELGCPPAQNAFAFVFTVNGHTATRFLPCHLNLASTGPATFVSPPPGAATPTPIAFPNQIFSPPPTPTASPCAPPRNSLNHNECVFPLTTNIARLFFYNPTVQIPEVQDIATQADLGPDPNGNNVHISEAHYQSTYTATSTDCDTLAPINSQNDPGTGVDFALTPLVNPPTGFHDCTLTFRDLNTQLQSVQVSVAGPLTIVDDSTKLPPPGNIVFINATQGGWLPVTLDAIKANFANPIIISHNGCEGNVSFSSFSSQLVLNGIATTFNGFGVDVPCTLVVGDQFPAVNNPSPDSVSLAVSVQQQQSGASNGAKLILNLGTSFDAQCIVDLDNGTATWFPYMEVDHGGLSVASLKSETSTGWLWTNPGPITSGLVINAVKPDNSAEPNGPGVLTSYRDGNGTIYTLDAPDGNLVADQQAFDPVRTLPDSASIPVTVYLFHTNNQEGCPSGGTPPGTVVPRNTRINPLTHRRIISK